MPISSLTFDLLFFPMIDRRIKDLETLLSGIPSKILSGLRCQFSHRSEIWTTRIIALTLAHRRVVEVEEVVEWESDTTSSDTSILPDRSSLMVMMDSLGSGTYINSVKYFLCKLSTMFSMKNNSRYTSALFDL